MALLQSWGFETERTHATVTGGCRLGLSVAAEPQLKATASAAFFKYDVVYSILY